MLEQSDALAIYRVLSGLGVDCSTLKAENPFSSAFSSTPRGREIQMMLQEAAPQLAVKLKGQIGHADSIPSLAYAAQAGDSVDPSTLPAGMQQEWAERNPGAAAKQAELQHQQQLKEMEQALEQRQRQRMGNRAYEQQQMQEQQRKLQKERDRQAAIEFDQRLAAKKAELQRMNPLYNPGIYQ